MIKKDDVTRIYIYIKISLISDSFVTCFIELSSHQRLNVAWAWALLCSIDSLIHKQWMYFFIGESRWRSTIARVRCLEWNINLTKFNNSTRLLIKSGSSDVVQRSTCSTAHQINMIKLNKLWHTACTATCFLPTT